MKVMLDDVAYMPERAHEATRRGISYGDLQQELLCKKYTKIKPPPGLIEERRRKQRKKILAEMEAKKKATRGRTT